MKAPIFRLGTNGARRNHERRERTKKILMFLAAVAVTFVLGFTPDIDWFLESLRAHRG